MKSNTDIGLLLVRVGLGLVFMAHGYDKLSDMQGAVGFFSSLGLAAFWAYLVAWIELLGGLGMLLGVCTGWAGVLLAATMVVSIGMVKIAKGFLGGYEFELMLFLAAVAISLSGPGAYTLRKLWKKA